MRVNSLSLGKFHAWSSTRRYAEPAIAKNHSLLFVLLTLFGLIGKGHQFDQKQQGEGVSSSGLLKMSKGITNLADVQCGRQLVRVPKIVGGKNAYQGEFPWLVSMKEINADSDTFSHFCGGAILNRRHVLTAAHCFEKYFRGDEFMLRLLRVTVGEHDLTEEAPNSFNFGVVKLIVHPKFDMRRYSNDVAILELDKDIEWSSFVGPACLVNEDFPENGERQQRNATVAGWGSIVDIVGDQAGKFPNTLQKTTVPILDNVECQQWFTRSGVRWSPKDTHLCAGYAEGGFDSCRGDSGGPLMIETESESNRGNGRSSDLTVIGIVAAGKGCARPYLPGVYTRVSKFVDWISQNAAV